VLLLFLPHGIVSLAPLAKRLGVRRA
jgi:hypothetical protein